MEPGTNAIPMARCQLSGHSGEDRGKTVRYVPLSELGLWLYLMTNRHRRRAWVESVSHWLPEDPGLWNSGYAEQFLDPVLRVRFEAMTEHGVVQPVERFIAAFSYPAAQEALLSHYPRRVRATIEATPGYFVAEQRIQASA
jgi:hypothetical protein